MTFRHQTRCDTPWSSNDSEHWHLDIRQDAPNQGVTMVVKHCRLDIRQDVVNHLEPVIRNKPFSVSDSCHLTYHETRRDKAGSSNGSG